ncbi:S8 family serine peptidase, partial [Luteimonas panaciterrae]|uniref:S8 family serine peptidase n=1 Tax=Luteimonas panaciterrae TaxID=363885 RepID=UPI001CF92FBE
GTSAATPMVSGVAALMLEANPRLTYRDVKYILATTARQIHPDQPDVRHPDDRGQVLVPGWTKNAAGHAFSNWYGFGLVDATAAVTKAADFKPLPPLVDSGWKKATPDDSVDIGGKGAPARIVIDLKEAAERIESVQ